MRTRDFIYSQPVHLSITVMYSGHADMRYCYVKHSSNSWCTIIVSFGHEDKRFYFRWKQLEYSRWYFNSDMRTWDFISAETCYNILYSNFIRTWGQGISFIHSQYIGHADMRFCYVKHSFNSWCSILVSLGHEDKRYCLCWNQSGIQ